MKLSKNRILLFSVLFIIALSLRMPGISFYPLWFDETSTAFVVSQPASSMAKTINTIEATPPLFFFLEKGFIHLVHARLSELSLRFVPAVFGALSCILFFLLFREIPLKRIEYFTFSLIAVSNFHIFTSQDARAYSLLLFMVLTTILLTLHWWKKPGTGPSLWLFFSVAFIVQVHYYAVLWVMALFLGVLLAKPKEKRLKNYLLIVAGAGCLSFAPLVPLFMTQITYEINPSKDYLVAKWVLGIVFSPVKALIGAYLFKINTVQDISIWDFAGILPTLVILVLTLCTFLNRLVKREVSDAEKIIVFCFIAAYGLHLLIGWKVPTIHPQYMFHFLILLFGFVLVYAPERYAIRTWVFVFFMLINIVASIRYYTSSKPYLDPWREIAAAIDNHIAREGAADEAVIAEYPTCVSICFYLKNKDARFFQSYNPFLPDLRNTYARLNMFGNAFLTELFHYRYFPIDRRTSIRDVMISHKQGILVERRNLPIDNVHERLQATYKGEVDFTPLTIFETNQGKIALIHWKVREK
jgi:hypothetical protein